MLAQFGTAQTSTWVGFTAPGDMNDPTNWMGGVPMSGNDTLVFPAGTTPTFIYTAINNFGTAFSVGDISITSPSNSYTLSNTGSSSFSIVGGSHLTASATTTAQHLISMPIGLLGTWNIKSSSAATGLTISGNITGSSGIIDLQNGQLVLSGTANTFASIIIEPSASPPAILTVQFAGSLPPLVTDNGALIFAPTVATAQDCASTISGTGTVQMNGAASSIWNLTGTNSYTGGTTITAGTLGISNIDNLGGPTVGVPLLSLGAGTLQLNAAGGYVLPITLTGAGTISTPMVVDATINGVISESPAGAGSLSIVAGTATSPQTITLAMANTYTKGTTVSMGTLSIAQQSNLGTGPLTLGVAAPGVSILSITSPITAFTTPITLQGPSTIQLNSNAVTIAKPITGSGLLTINTGSSGTTLTLSSVAGVNAYTGGTSITTGIVLGDTNSIEGPYTLASGTTLTFDQTISHTSTVPSITSGTYSGVLTASDSTANLIKVNAGTVILTGASGTTFLGTTTVNGGTLSVMAPGSLQSSNVIVNAGGSFTGVGAANSTTTGNVNSITVAGGTVGPNGLNTLLVNGTTGVTPAPGSVSFNGSSTFAVNVAPEGISDLLNVTNLATLGSATVAVQPESGFYGFGSTFTILKAGTLNGTFGSVTSTNSNLIFSLLQTATTVELELKVIRPFLGFPAENKNVQSVINNIDALSASGALASNAGLTSAINSFAGQSFAVINNALDQMQPAIFSAFGELQTELGSQIVSLFHRRPGPTCCQKTWRVWAEPFGTWLNEKNVGMQHGFDSQSRGVAAGFDWELLQNLILGFGGAANHSDLLWHNNRGSADVNSYYGAAYADYTYKFFYVGGSLLAGVDHYDTQRRLAFTTIDETAAGKHDAFDLVGQLSCGLFFGPSACCFWPYINIDYFLLDHSSFKESGAPGLNLNIQGFSAQTIRTELGIGLQVQDTNYNETMCVSPRFSLGWTMEQPIKRDKITSTFQDETLSFNVEGWDQIWQLFSFTLGLNLSYKCFTLGGEYVGELDNNNRFWGQKANVNLVWNW